jgi:hypothetical protein
VGVIVLNHYMRLYDLGREEAEICRDGSKERQRRFFYHLGLPPNGGGTSKITPRMALPP